MGFQSFCNQVYFPFRLKTSEPNQEHPVPRALQSKDQLAEVLICRDEERTRPDSQLENEIVIDPRIELGHIADIQPILAKAVDDEAVNPFVGKELQAASPATG